MTTSRGRRRGAVVVVALALGLPPAGGSHGADARVAPDLRSRAAAAQPLIEAAPGLVAFSPDGDGRRDRGRTRFTLTEPARVRVTLRSAEGSTRARLQLGRLSAGRHVWMWDGRMGHARVAADGSYRIRLTATTATRTQSATATALVDTVRPRGRLVTTRPTVYPEASVVDDHVQLLWLLDGWTPWEEEMGGDVSEQPARAVMEIRTRTGRLVWRGTSHHRYTPVFDWYARRAGGRALAAGRYVARVTVADAAGNRRRDRRRLRVSHAQLAKEVWTVSLAAAATGTYTPYFGGCNGCADSCAPVDSERFPDGLSFRPCAEAWRWGTTSYLGSDVPFAEAPVDSFRIVVAGGPTTVGAADWGQVDGTRVGPGDASAATPWRTVDLTGHPYLPGRDRPVTWSFTTFRPNSYDVATFTVEYRHFVPVSGVGAVRPAGRGAALSSRRR